MGHSECQDVRATVISFYDGPLLALHGECVMCGGLRRGRVEDWVSFCRSAHQPRRLCVDRLALACDERKAGTTAITTAGAALQDFGC